VGDLARGARARWRQARRWAVSLHWGLPLAAFDDGAAGISCPLAGPGGDLELPPDPGRRLPWWRRIRWPILRAGSDRAPFVGCGARSGQRADPGRPRRTWLSQRGARWQLGSAR
jgi:hypothetical protein